MCKPKRCKLKLTCERYTAKAIENQIYFENEPSNPDGTACPMYFKKNCKPCGEI